MLRLPEALIAGSLIYETRCHFVTSKAPKSALILPFLQGQRPENKDWSEIVQNSRRGLIAGAATNVIIH